MASITRIAAGTVAALFAATLMACEQPKPASESLPGPAATEPAGKIGGQKVTVGEIDQWIKDQLFKQATRGNNPMKIYEVRNRAFEQMANEKALDGMAAKAGKDRDALLKEEVEKRTAVADEDIQKYYDDHKDRFRNLPFEKVAPAVKRQLQAQKQVTAMQDFTKGLRDELGFESKLEPPRFDLAAKGPSQGPADAPVTLVEFSDYECPFCKASESVLKQVLERYPTQVRLIYKNFPLENHPKARPAAEASLCADEQGKFWDYHKKLFEKSPQIAAEQLGPIATEAGLDAAKLDECMKAKKVTAQIDADLAEGKKAGVAGTPAFYVNGVPIAGGRSVDDFAKAINAELERKGLPVPPAPPPAAAQMTPVPPPGAPQIIMHPGQPPAPGAPPAVPGAPPSAAPGAPSAQPPAPAPAPPAVAPPPAAANPPAAAQPVPAPPPAPSKPEAAKPKP